MMRGALQLLVLCTFSFVAAAAGNFYIKGPVTVLDCKSPRQEDHWMIGTTEATTQITEKPFDPSKFYDAARVGDLQYIEDEVSRLGPSGLNLDWQNSGDLGRTALHVAVDENKPTIVSALLQAGANPNLQDDDGKTPVYKAARHCYSATLELLLTQGRGDPNIVTSKGDSPLMIATAFGHSVCVRALIAAGAHVDYVNPNDGYMGGTTALHWAAYHNEPDVALVLLEAGATKDTEDNDYDTPADVAESQGFNSVADLINNH